MPTYQVTYFNAKHTVMDSEAIFMKSLTNAKRSAEHHAPDGTKKNRNQRFDRQSNESIDAG
ncbi:hypothetical protein [Vibrio parahaemolyticus]|jgi:hypothetical protein|uniref:hypothetical protein n=1 Tax=Vibrio harveyi group TaxID=717610 RepID=UPI000A2FD5E2|nr:hypothetical protein Vc3S01_p30119 [Vibrio campbellii]